MKKYSCLAIAVLLLMGFAGQTYANVFAAHLSKTATGGSGSEAFDLSYRLNEAASSVSVEIIGPLPATTVVQTIAGGTAKGLNTVQWDGTVSGGGRAAVGDYGWKVTATDSTGHTAQYDQITTDTDTTVQFYYPRGLAINTDQTSDYFGCVYVVESQGGATTAGRTTTEGIFILNNDMTAYDSQGDAGHQGGVAWEDSASGPYRVSLDDDGNLFISDWTDAHSGIWKAPPDCQGTWPAALTEAGRDGDGLATNHGSIMAVLAEGSGASTKIYTLDEDYPATTDNGRGSINEYAIGTSTDYSQAPTVVYDDTTPNLVQNYRNDLARGNDGWWVTQQRSTGNNSATVPSFFHYSTTSSTVDYNSGTAQPAGINSSYGSLAISADGGTMLLGDYANLHVLDISGFPGTAPSVVASIASNPAGGNSYVNAIAYDAAGNFYFVTNQAELLRGFSPDDGANSFTTTNPDSQALAITIAPATPTPSSDVSPKIWQNVE